MFDDWLNSLVPGVIRLKCNFSEHSLEFLDLKIIIENGRLETELYVKPTNLQLFLDYNSNHPKHCKDAIVYCQALRVIERCSKPDSAEPHLERLRGKFLERNYPPELVDEQFKKAKTKDRKQLIFQARKQKSKVDDKCRLIFTHNTGNPPLHDWMKKSKKLLVSAKAKKFGAKFQISYKQPQNLKKTVSGPNKGQGGRGALVAPHGEAGCFKCNHCRVYLALYWLKRRSSGVPIYKDATTLTRD